MDLFCACRGSFAHTLLLSNGLLLVDLSVFSAVWLASFRISVLASSFDPMFLYGWGRDIAINWIVHNAVISSVFCQKTTLVLTRFVVVSSIAGYCCCYKSSCILLT